MISTSISDKLHFQEKPRKTSMSNMMTIFLLRVGSFTSSSLMTFKLPICRGVKKNYIIWKLWPTAYGIQMHISTFWFWNLLCKVFATPQHIFPWSAPEPCSPVGKWLDGPLPKDTQIPHTPPNIAGRGQDFGCIITLGRIGSLSTRVWHLYRFGYRQRFEYICKKKSYVWIYPNIFAWTNNYERMSK